MSASPAGAQNAPDEENLSKNQRRIKAEKDLVPTLTGEDERRLMKKRKPGIGWEMLYFLDIPSLVSFFEADDAREGHLRECQSSMTGLRHLRDKLSVLTEENGVYRIVICRQCYNNPDTELKKSLVALGGTKLSNFKHHVQKHHPDHHKRRSRSAAAAPAADTKDDTATSRASAQLHSLAAPAADAKDDTATSRASAPLHSFAGWSLGKRPQKQNVVAEVQQKIYECIPTQTIEKKEFWDMLSAVQMAAAQGISVGDYQMSIAMISTKNRSKWSRPEFWRDKVPSFLTITESKNHADSLSEETRKPSHQWQVDGQKRRQALKDRGYCLVDEMLPPTAQPPNVGEKASDDDASRRNEQIDKLAEGIVQLHQQHRLPASFILLFDQTWELARASYQAVLQPSTAPGNQFHFDILAWFIENDGFSPHRDRQPENDSLPRSFGEDGDAKFVTHWIALTDATPENSCLYMIPKPLDPGYMAGDCESGGKDPLQRALPDKRAFQHIRAMPRTAGQSVLFTHRILHWGSCREKETRLPHRIAISFVCSDPSFEKPYVDPKYFGDETLPPFSIRLLLVCAQMLIYYQRFNLSKDFTRACYEYCKAHENELEESYRQKVFVEFVKAMKEHQKQQPMVKPSKDNDDEEDEEAMMEAMLQAAKKGYGDFEDDYDEQFGGDDAMDGVEDGDDDEEEEEATLQFKKRVVGAEPPKKRRAT